MTYIVMFLPAAAALAIVLIARRRSGAAWCDKLGPPGWSFSSSWASSLTAVLAVFQMLFAQNLLPPGEPYIPKATYAAFAVMFAALLLAAPVVYLALGRLEPPQKEVQIQGRVWGFVVAAFLVLWAIIGQLVETFVLSVDVARGPLDNWIAGVFVLLSAILVVAAALHGGRTVHFILKNLQSSGRFAASFAQGNAPAWFLP
jgi:hypothetical protein